MSGNKLALKPGTVVDRFTVQSVLAVGETSIFYRVVDSHSDSPFILREYLPPACPDRQSDGSFFNKDEPVNTDAARAIAIFLAETARAGTLRHQGIAPISRGFRANGTGYHVLPHFEGRMLSDWLEGDPKLDSGSLLKLSNSLLEVLEFLHGQNIVHQDIRPEYILVIDTGAAVLLSCGGAARQAPGMGSGAGENPNQYHALEQLQPSGKIGPWTDIYAFAAVLHHCLTGEPCVDASTRAAAIGRQEVDPQLSLQTTSEIGSAERKIINLINRGLALESSARPKSIREWQARLSGETEPDKAQTKSGADKGSLASPKPQKQRLPSVLFGLFLASMAAVAIFLIINRTDPKSAIVPVPVQPQSGIPAREVERWRQALEANAVVAYRAFMADFPDSVHITQAQEHIDLLENKAWEKVLAENTEAAFEAHLEQFPDGQHATQALVRIEEFRQEAARLARQQNVEQSLENEAWNAARSTATVQALDAYLAAWPGGEHTSQARALRQSIQTDQNDAARFRLASEQHTIEAYRDYISDFPSGKNVSTALESIDSLTLRTGKSFRDCTDCPLMVVIPAGAFWQGSSETSLYANSLEKPRRRVIISEPFAVGVYEITMQEWDVCVDDGACETRPTDNGWGRGNRPAMMISWNDAVQYAQWLSSKTGQSYSLPSESEWEYMARAGVEGDWLGGNPENVCQYGNIAGSETSFEWRHKACEDGLALATAPVGSYQANAFGVYDVIGNVAEWTRDCMNLSYLEAPSDGSAFSRGMCSSRMTRGGSWFTGTRESRLASRFNLKNGDRNDFTGVRLVRRVEEQ